MARHVQWKHLRAARPPRTRHPRKDEQARSASRDPVLGGKSRTKRRTPENACGFVEITPGLYHHAKGSSWEHAGGRSELLVIYHDRREFASEKFSFVLLFFHIRANVRSAGSEKKPFSNPLRWASLGAAGLDQPPAALRLRRPPSASANSCRLRRRPLADHAHANCRRPQSPSAPTALPPHNTPPPAARQPPNCPPNRRRIARRAVAAERPPPAERLPCLLPGARHERPPGLPDRPALRTARPTARRPISPSHPPASSPPRPLPARPSAR